MYREEILKGNKNYNKDTLEKVLRLCDVLDFIYNDKLLTSTLVLKGGTAINLIYTNMPRLSVDIDLDFNANCDKDEMLQKRNVITNKIVDYMKENNYILDEDCKMVAALDSMLFSYTNNAGNKDYIKIEINYLMRQHVYEIELNKKQIDTIDRKININTLNVIELYGAKIKALLERGAARDLYDTAYMIKNKLINKKDEKMLKKCIIFYLTVGCSRTKNDIDLSFKKIDKLNINDVKRKLLPVLTKGTFYDLEEEKNLVRKYLEKILVLNNNEKEYLESFKKGTYKPELLFDDEKILNRIKYHPMALWKTRQNS